MKHLFYRMYHMVLKLSIKLVNFPEPKLLKGEGTINRVPEEIKGLFIEGKVLIATDKVLIELGLLDVLFAQLKEDGIRYTVFDGVKPDPTTNLIEEAVTLYNTENCGGIIAFGGGSAIDLSKAVAARVKNPNQSLDKMAGYFKIKKRPAPLIAIPTTAGTGSEATVASVITSSKTHVKHLINDFKIVPRVAILDSTLMVGLPPSITASTGIDALTHSVESYIGVIGNKKTRKDAIDSVKIIMKDLEKVYENGSDLSLRENLAIASFLAGRSCTKAYIGNVHALAHAIGSIYGIPHGEANAVLLPEVLDYYGESVHKPLAELAVVSNLGSYEEDNSILAKKFIQQIRKMNANMGIPSKFDELKRKDFETICQRANDEANPHYPVPKIMGKEDFKAVLERVYVN